MATKKLLQDLKFEEYKVHRNKERERSGSSNQDDFSLEQLSELFDSVKLYALDKEESIRNDLKAMKAVSKGKPPSFNESFETFIEVSKKEVDARRKGDTRRCLFWNIGSIHDKEGNIKSLLKTLIEKIKPDIILINEICLQYKGDSSVQREVMKRTLTKQMSDENYTLRCVAHSYKIDSHWILGSAIFTHKYDTGFDYKAVSSGKKKGYEYAAITNKKWNLSLYCCYIPNNAKMTVLTPAAVKLNRLEKAIGCGDFNIPTERFESIFDDLTDCMNEHWITHKNASEKHSHSKIDYIFKTRDTDNISVTVHKPLRPDSDLIEAHYPIIFDISKHEDGFEEGDKQCVDKECVFGCGNRSGGVLQTDGAERGEASRRYQDEEDPEAVREEAEQPKKRGRGRPPGSKNKPKN